MLRAEAIKIAQGDLWAEDGDRTLPDDASLPVQVSRRVGWPESFSEAAGNNAPRRFWNQRFREWQGAAKNAIRFGVEPYDPLVDYPANGLTAVGRSLYRAATANGPTGSNVTSPTTQGQAVWSLVSGRVVNPSAPTAPTATAGNGNLDWIWDCPRDGGRPVTHFLVQWRVGSTGAWTDAGQVITSAYRLSGLVNETQYQLRVRAVTAAGMSAWSNAGTGSPASVQPGQIFGLVAIDGEDAQVSLRWPEPNNGGTPITNYIIQWRTESQSFASGRQSTTTSLSLTVQSLTNGTEYLFRIRPINARGNGPWSSEVSGTPEEPPPPPPVIPDDTTPGQAGEPSATAVGTNVLWRWSHPTDGGRRILRFEYQLRVQGSGAWPDEVSTTSSCHLQTAVTASTTYEMRVRAVNALGDGSWSDTGEYDG